MNRIIKIITRPTIVMGLAIAWPFLNFVQANYRQMFLADFIVIAIAFLFLLFTALAITYLTRRIAGDHPAMIIAYGGAAFSWVFLNYRLLADTFYNAVTAMSLGINVNYIYLACAALAFFIGGAMALKRETRILFSSFCFVVCASALTSLAISALTSQDAVFAALGNGDNKKSSADSSALAGRGYLDGQWFGDPFPAPETKPNPATLPNLYYLIVDEYGRQDILKHYTGFDNAPTIDALRNYGFRVIDNAYSNFPMTFLSLSTSLGMHYPVSDGAKVEAGPYLSALQGSNAAVQSFKALGYNYAHMPSNQWGGSSCGNDVDLCLVVPRTDAFKVFDNSWETINLIARMTPLSYFLRINVIQDGYNPSLLDKIINFWPQVQQKKPLFLFAHTLPPHLPFIFKPDCTRQDHFSMDLTSDGGNYRALYVENLRCASRAMLKLVEHLSKADPGAIIIIQSDHGTQFTWKGVGPVGQNNIDALRERLGILMAIHAPAHCMDRLYDGITPVNILRFAYACVTGEPPRYRDDWHYPLHKPEGDDRYYIGAPLRPDQIAAPH